MRWTWSRSNAIHARKRPLFHSESGGSQRGSDDFDRVLTHPLRALRLTIEQRYVRRLSRSSICLLAGKYPSSAETGRCTNKDRLARFSGLLRETYDRIECHRGCMHQIEQHDQRAPQGNLIPSNEVVLNREQLVQFFDTSKIGPFSFHFHCSQQLSAFAMHLLVGHQACILQRLDSHME
jgi:hypothetical protein